MKKLLLILLLLLLLLLLLILLLVRLGRCLAWDATCPETFAVSHVLASSIRAGSTVATVEAMKSRKYATGVDFIPIAIETSGTCGEHIALEFGRRMATVTHEPRSTAFLRQRISVAIQRCNAYCVTGTFRRSDSAFTEIWTDSNNNNYNYNKLFVCVASWAITVDVVIQLACQWT